LELGEVTADWIFSSKVDESKIGLLFELESTIHRLINRWLNFSGSPEMGHLRAARRPLENVGISDLDDDSVSYFLGKKREFDYLGFKEKLFFLE